MAAEQYSIDEVCDRGEQIYGVQIERQVDAHENGMFIVVDSGDN